MSSPFPPTAPLGARTLAAFWDYLLISAWIVVVTLIGFVLRPLLDVTAGTLPVIGTDLVAFAVTVLPVFVYFTVAESRRRQASLGKQWARLRVVTVDGSDLGPGRAALRTAVKLAPWQLAHLAVARMILDGSPVVIVTTYAASLLLVILTVAMVLLDAERRALHDRVAGTRVISVRAAGPISTFRTGSANTRQL